MTTDPTVPDAPTDPTAVLDADPAPGTVDRGTDERPVDVVSLVAGVVTLVLAAAFSFGDLHDLADQNRVVWPTILLGVGVALLGTTSRRR